MDIQMGTLCVFPVGPGIATPSDEAPAEIELRIPPPRSVQGRFCFDATAMAAACVGVNRSSLSSSFSVPYASF